MSDSDDEKGEVVTFTTLHKSHIRITHTFPFRDEYETERGEAEKWLQSVVNVALKNNPLVEEDDDFCCQVMTEIGLTSSCLTSLKIATEFIYKRVEHYSNLSFFTP